jgi:uncharacterized protein YtpQ (UPF0354 family)
VPLRALPLVAAVLVLLAAGCAGNDEPPAPEPVPSAFKEAVTAALKLADLEVEQDFDLNLDVSLGPNRIDLALDEPYDEYEAAPERRDEIVAAVVADAEQRLERGIADTSFEDAKPDLMPLLQAPFAVRGYGFEPAQTQGPGDLKVVYAVDADDAFTILTREDLERWGTSAEEVHRLALANLLQQTNEQEELLCEPAGLRELCGWSSGDGYDATRMIVPGLRRQIVKKYDGPAVYAVPQEYVFVALPLEVLDEGDAEAGLRAKVAEDFQTGDDPVSPELFVERNGKLVVRE